MVTQYVFRFFLVHIYSCLLTFLYLSTLAITMAEAELELPLEPEEEAAFLAMYSSVKFDPLGMFVLLFLALTFTCSENTGT